MKAFIASLIAVIVIAAAAGYAMNEMAARDAGAENRMLPGSVQSG